MSWSQLYDRFMQDCIPLSFVSVSSCLHVPYSGKVMCHPCSLINLASKRKYVCSAAGPVGLQSEVCILFIHAYHMNGVFFCFAKVLLSGCRMRENKNQIVQICSLLVPGTRATDLSTPGLGC